MGWGEQWVLEKRSSGGQAICYPNRRDVPSYSPVLCFQRREEARDRVARQSQPLLLAGEGW